MYRIEVTVRAREDADEEFAWLADKVSPEFAAAWYGGLFEQIDTLVHFPARCPVAVESPRFPDEVRELIYGQRRHKYKYRILFSIRDDVVSVLTIQHSSRREVEP